MFLRLGEDDGDRLQLRDRDDAGLLPGVDEIALVDEAEAGAARDRGADGRIVELRPRGVDRRGVGGDRGGELQHQRVLRVELLLGGEVLLGERGVAGEVELGVGEVGLVLRFLGDGLVERGLERPRVDLGQKIALLDHLAFVEGDLHDLAVDARPDQDGVVGLDLADALEDDRKIRALDRRHSDDNRRGAGRLRLLALPLRRCGLSGRSPDPVVQLVGEPAGGRKPPVCRFGRVNAIGGGCAARQYGDPHEPAEPHRRKPFFAPTTAQTKHLHALRARRAPRPIPQHAAFSGAGSHGIFANTILLVGAGHHQPNLTGRIAFARQRSSAPDAI